MKTKVIIIISIVAIALGGVCGVVGMSELGWDFTKLDPVVYTPAVYEDADSSGIKEIRMELRSFPVEVVRGEAFKIDYHTTEKYPVTPIREGAKLTLHEKKKWKWSPYMFRDLGSMNLKVVVTLPEEMVVSLTGDCANSSLSVTGGTFTAIDYDSSNGGMVLDRVNADSISFDSSNAGVRFESVVSKTVDLHTSNGKLDFISVTADTLTAESSNAKVNVGNGKFGTARFKTSNDQAVISGMRAENFYLKTSNAGARLTGVNTDSFELYTSNGRITTDGLTSGKLRLSSSNAGMTLGNVKADAIRVSTSNGKIEGNVLGALADYKVEVSTTNGSITPGKQDGNGSGKSFTASTSNADINVTFA